MSDTTPAANTMQADGDLDRAKWHCELAANDDLATEAELLRR
jgi:hypothetical protein